MKERTFFLLVALSLLIIIPKVRSANDASRMAAIESFVDFHTVSIDSSQFIGTIDKVFIQGKFYSEKPPFPSLIGALIYLPFSSLGIKLNQNVSLAYYLICLFSIKLIWLSGVWCFYKILELLAFKGNKIFLTSFLAFGSLYFTWSTTFNNHIISAALLIIAFYFWMKLKSGNFSNKSFTFLSGLFFLFSGICDLPTLIFFPIFLTILIYSHRKIKTTLIFSLPLLITMLPYLLFNYLVSGNVKPLQIDTGYFQYENSYWLTNGYLSGTTQNDKWFAVKHLFEMMISEQGFLIYNPILFVSIGSLIFFRKIFSIIKLEIIGMIIGISIILLFYAFYTNDFGGWSYSVRWFVCMLPYMILMAFPFFENLTKLKKISLTILLFLGIIISSVGIINPWSKSYYSEIPFIANIENIIHYFSAD